MNFWGKRTPRRGRGRKMRLPSDNDLSLSLIAMLAEAAAKTPRPKKRAAPRRSMPKTRAMGRTAAATPAAPMEVVTLEDTPEANNMKDTVESKVGDFFESGSFISSDEDEAEILTTKRKKNVSSNMFFISDESDDDFIRPSSSSASHLDIAEPSTSAGTSSSSSKHLKLQNSIDDDIMGFVDSVLVNTDNKESDLKDMKSLEDFRKETEEMLNRAATLFEEIKTGRPAAKAAGPNTPDVSKIPQTSQEDSPVVTVGSCPICLESLAKRAASVTICGHIFCTDCILATAKIQKKCPTCRKAISAKKIHPVYF